MLGLLQRLGQGAYGRVNRGEWNCDSVAVKEFEDDDWDTYETELEQLSMVNHPNIIQLLAFARDTNMKFLVMEYADRGSLYKGTTKSFQCAIGSWKYFMAEKSISLIGSCLT